MKKLFILFAIMVIFLSCDSGILEKDSFYPPESINIQKLDRYGWSKFERHGIKYLMYNVSGSIFIMEDK